MDTSKTYIRMCEKARELQFAWEGRLGDVVRHQGKGIIYYTKPSDLLQGDGCIWLPRQDQLQEMMPSVNYENNLAHLAWMFDKFCNSSRANPFQPLAENYVILSTLTSMEQLWLAFVMKEKYKKTWNGTKWEVNK